MIVKSLRCGRRLVLLTVALAVGASTVGYATTGGDQASERKLSRDEQLQLQAVYQLVDRAMAGESSSEAPGFTMGWHNDFLKAQEGRIYVPFTISVDRKALANPEVAFYVRVVSRAPADEAAGDKDRAQTPAVFAFEDVWFPELKVAATGRYEISRAFAVPPGDYDVYVGLREQPKDKKVPAKTSVLSQAITAPDFWNGELATSSVIVADTVEPIAAALSPDEQIEEPYTIGKMRITPATDLQYSKNEELSVIFLVYNPALKEKKPDIQVDYRFHQVTAEGEKYFNRTPPNVMNAETLGEGFDMDAGYQLVAGQAVPLGSFPDGDYRLEILVQDKLGEKTVTRDVFFSVTGG